MRYARIAVSTVFLLAALTVYTAGQSVPDEARRHFDRGMAFVELAKSPDDFKAAIAEFKQATVLAPDWADAQFNLAKVQEAAEMFKDAVASLRKYLQLAPNAPDADAVRSLINRIELKAEQVLTIPVIVDVLAEFGKPPAWSYTATLRSGDRQCRRAWSELELLRESSDSIKALSSMQYYTGPSGINRTYQSLKVTGPVLTYVTRINVCDGAANREFGDCTSIIENEVTVISRTLVKVGQRVIRRGDGAGTAAGDVYECEFKKDVKAATASFDLFQIVSDREKVVEALAAGVDVNAKNRFGNTLLQQAVIDGYADVAELLIANGADLTVRDQYGQTLLHRAAANGSVRIVTMLAAKGADIKAADNFGLLPLDKAVSSRKKDAAKLLISKGADIEAKDKYGNTPLQRAISADEAAFLIDLGANINVKDSFGSTPLHRAISQNQKGMAELLIAKGADVNARAAQGGDTPLHRAVADKRIEFVELLLNSGAKIDAKDDNGDTPLHRAVAGFPYSKDRMTVELLISKGADINAVNNAGYTPLQTAIEYCGRIEECAKKEMFDLLIAKGADIEAGSSGRSALQIAMINNRKNMAEVLIEKGASTTGVDVNLRDSEGKTALHKAADWNNVEATRELISKGADVNATDNNRSTPLHTAANAGSREVAELLIANGADMNALDKDGATPLFWAMAAAATRPARAAKYMTVFTLLIEKGVNINAGYKDGSTFLHDAVANGNKEAVEALIKKGVELNSRNKNGKTPLQLAVDSNKQEIAELLKKHAAM